MDLLSSINNSAIGSLYAVSAAKDVNGNDITGTYLTAVPAGYATESFVTSQGYITGNYLSADALDNVSGTWNTVTDKLDSTAFSTVSGNFLTAHQALPNSANWDEAYTTVSTNSADWNSAAAMNELPVSAGEGMDIQNVDGNIVFSCTGGSVPEGVLVESGLEYNAVNEISGYSGSAFAQYGAEKQWLQHDDTLLHVANSAQYALGVNLSAVAQLLGVDETVLWSGIYGSTALSLSESPLNFNTIKVYYGGHNNNASGQNSYYGCAEFEPVINGTTAEYMPINSTFIGALGTNTIYEVYTMWSGVNTTEWERIYYAWKNITGTSWNTGSNWQSVYKVVGIGRKEV